MSVRDVFTGDSLSRPVIAGSTLLFLVMLVLPMFIDPFQVNILTRILILAFFGMAFNLAFGFANLPSFGHAAFFGLGAYGMAIAFDRLELELIFVPIAIAILAAMIFSVFMGLASLRGRGIYFALLTFAIAQFLYEIAFRWTEFTGGDDGLIMFVPPVFGFDISGPENVYYIALVLLVLLTVAMHRILNSPFGKVMEAIRKNDDRTGAIGYPVKRIQLIVFVLSGTLGSIAGILQALNNQFVSPSVLFWQQSVDVLVVAIIGGTTTLLGPIVGATFLILLREAVRELSNLGIIITGVVFIIIILVASEGIAGVVRDYLKRE